MKIDIFNHVMPQAYLELVKQYSKEPGMVKRMGSLRMTVREYNVYRWAGRMLADAGRWRMRARIEARVQRHMSTIGPVGK